MINISIKCYFVEIVEIKRQFKFCSYTCFYIFVFMIYVCNMLKNY